MRGKKQKNVRLKAHAKPLFGSFLHGWSLFSKLLYLTLLFALFSLCALYYHLLYEQISPSLHPLQSAQLLLIFFLLHLLHFLATWISCNPQWDHEAIWRLSGRLHAQTLYKPPKALTQESTQSPLPVIDGNIDQQVDRKAPFYDLICIHLRAAQLFSTPPCALHLLPSPSINCFSLENTRAQGSIWITQGAIDHLNGDELLSLLAREYTPCCARKKLLLWSSSYTLGWLFFQGQALLSIAQIPYIDPRPWHRKQGHPLGFFGLIFLLLGAPGALFSYLLPKLWTPHSLALQQDRYALESVGDKVSFLSLLEKSAKYQASSYPRNAGSFFCFAMHDPRFLSQHLLASPSWQERREAIIKIKPPKVF